MGKLNKGAIVAVASYSFFSVAALIYRSTRPGSDTPAVRFGLGVVLPLIVIIIVALSISYLVATKKYVPLATAALVSGDPNTYVFAMTSTPQLLRAIAGPAQVRGKAPRIRNLWPCVLMRCDQENLSFWVGIRKPQRVATIPWAEIESISFRTTEIFLSRSLAIVLKTSGVSTARTIELIPEVLKSSGRFVSASDDYVESISDHLHAFQTAHRPNA